MDTQTADREGGRKTKAMGRINMTPLRTETPEGDIYEVFARFHEKRLHHIGSVVAINDELAKLYTAKLYDEWSWREVVIVKRADITTVIAPL